MAHEGHGSNHNSFREWNLQRTRNAEMQGIETPIFAHLELSAVRRPLKKAKKNRASQSGGDRKARGIFELSTTVGLRRTSNLELYREPDPKSLMG